MDGLGTWVDFAYSGTELGALEQPFNTLAESVGAPAVGGTVMVKTGATSERPTITKHVAVVAWGGSVLVGQ